MREFQRMTVRPRSTHTVTEFGGLLHNEEAPLGRWYDERNLSADGAPGMTLTTGASMCYEVDGNTLDYDVVAVCGGDHLVILDVEGTVYCNGHKIQYMLENYVREIRTAEMQMAHGSGSIEYNVNRDTLPLLEAAFGEQSDYTWICDSEDSWACGDERWRPDDLRAEFGIVLTVTSGAVEVGDEIVIHVASKIIDYDTVPRTIVRMGALATIWPDALYVDAVKLASGAEMIAGSDYGSLNYKTYHRGAHGNETAIQTCNLDGKAYNDQTEIVSQSTEPANHDVKWIDTSGNEPTMRAWSAAMVSWVVIPATYLRISPVQLVGNNGAKLRKGDVVKFDATYFPDYTDPGLMNLLNGWHYIYNIVENENAIVVSGLLPEVSYTTTAIYTITRDAPKMDFVVECQNRLWGCYYGKNEAGDTLNEIYASSLGDTTNWHVAQGLSTDSWTASRGVAAPYTGAAVLHGSPLFFREESLEKVYPSSSGAHQIQTFDLDGVEAGAWRSICNIDDRLYYKGREAIYCYTGTMPQRISEAFGNLRYTGGSAGRHGKRYMIAMRQADTDELLIGDYDTISGAWHLLSDGWTGAAATWQDCIYYVRNSRLFKRSANTSMVNWYAESGIIGYELPEHRFVSCIRIRYTMRQPCSCRVYIQYENSGWILKQTLRKTSGVNERIVNTMEANIFPRRCDHFRIRFEGTGQQALFKILSISYRMERSEGGH